MPTRQERELEAEIKELEALTLSNPATAEPPEGDPTEVTTTDGVVTTEETSVSIETPEPTDVIAEETTEPEAQGKAQRTDWKKRYTNYKSTADTTIYQLRQDNSKLKDDVIELTDKVDELAKVVAEGVSSEGLPKDLLSSDERDLLGDETISVMEKVQEAMNKKFIKPLQDQLNRERELRKKAETNSAQDEAVSNSNKFLAKLEGIVPDYAEINVNKAFISWMDEADKDSGFTRAHIFTQAEKLGDVGRVAGFMKEFKRKTQRKSSVLEDNVTPSTSSSGVPPTDTSKDDEVFTLDQVNRFYDDCIRGKFKGRDKERQEIEAEIDQAIASGNVR
ncbi:MAG: hypothetical protein KAS32_25215 [Candidatus Peribacteraceae bacterium]|nr:hypothetical protein [Candidatus Peribacteraceae bacterium]